MTLDTYYAMYDAYDRLHEADKSFINRIEDILINLRYFSKGQIVALGYNDITEEETQLIVDILDDMKIQIENINK